MAIKMLTAVLALARITVQAAPLMEGASAGPGFIEVKMMVRDGHPVVDGVYVNGRGPFRFLVDTGTNVDLIDQKLARRIGLAEKFKSELASSTGLRTMPGGDGIEVLLDVVKANGQKFLFSGMEAIQNRWPDIQGVLGQWFLSRFDYSIDLRGKSLRFGKQVRSGTRSRFWMINGRPAVSTTLGYLILDSGADHVVLFGLQPNFGFGPQSELWTVTGSQEVGWAFGKLLVIEGRRIWRGDALAIPTPFDPGVDGLMPLSLFNDLYVCNSEGFVVFE